VDKNNIVELEGREQIVDPVTQLLRNGARRLIEQTVEAELEQLLAAHAVRRTDDDKAGVVRNGYLPERPLQTNLGPVTVRIPKVRAKSGEPVTFRSALVPPYVRKTRTLEAALPWLYLKGVSSGEMSEALGALIGPQAQGLSASVVSRLKKAWEAEYLTWCKQPLDKDRWVYVRADGVYSGLRAEQTKLCALVVIGVNERGEKHFLAIEDGVRESTQSWREVLLNFYAFPAQHWQSIRTSNPIESTFGTIRHRTRRSKGCLTRDGMLHKMFKLSQCAQKNWRKLRGFNYLAKVITGVQFKDGIEVTKANQKAA